MLTLLSIYFILLWIYGVVFCLEKVGTTPHLSEKEILILQIAIALLCSLIPVITMVIGIVALAKYTTEFQEKWRKS